MISVYSISDVAGESDIILLLDSSSSVSPTVFSAMKKFAAAAISGYTMQQGLTRVAIGNYGATNVVPARLTYNKQFLYSALSSITPVGGHRNMAAALRGMNSKVFMTQPRPNAGRVLVLFTTGLNHISASESLSGVAQELKGLGIELAVVAIGNEVDVNTLQQVATTPQNFIHMSSYYGLPDNIHPVLVLGVPKQGKDC